ncbi:MAG TPA: polysaccharide pyruvyl transferase family protein [Spongiibacteraceae bacterium]|jgi:pyruvyl transferase EpsO
MLTLNELLDKPLQLLADLLKGVDKVALLDYPEYANVGDSMIWLGQVALLRRLNKKIIYVCAISNFDEHEAAAAVGAGAALIINGGGNFGTLWPHHQEFRERIMTLFADALIIQMPQSICFEDEAALQRTRRIIGNCSNLHLLVRDHPSYAFARDNFSTDIVLCPDSAFFLTDLPTLVPDLDVVYLRRSDREADVNSGGGELHSSLAINVTDWLEQNWIEKQLQQTLRYSVRKKWLRNNQRVTIALYNLLAYIRTRRGVQLLARGRCIITDRLHAHVLSVLLKRPSFLLDNSNGKVFAFYEAWTRDLGVSRCVGSVREALRMASVLNVVQFLALQFFYESDVATVALAYVS